MLLLHLKRRHLYPKKEHAANITTTQQPPNSSVTMATKNGPVPYPFFSAATSTPPRAITFHRTSSKWPSFLRRDVGSPQDPSSSMSGLALPRTPCSYPWGARTPPMTPPQACACQVQLPPLAFPNARRRFPLSVGIHRSRGPKGPGAARQANMEREGSGTNTAHIWSRDKKGAAEATAMKQTSQILDPKP